MSKSWSAAKCLDIGQGEPVGSVSLAVGVVWLECIKEDVASKPTQSSFQAYGKWELSEFFAQMRSAAITNNFQATKLGHGAHMAAVSLLSARIAKAAKGAQGPQGLEQDSVTQPLSSSTS